MSSSLPGGFPRGALMIALLLAAPPSYALDPGRLLTQYVHDSWTTNAGLPQDSINAIAQTPDGYLWLATQEGAARFDGVNFTTFDSRNTPAFDSDFVHTLFVDHHGTLWIGVGSGLLRYDGRNTFTKFEKGFDRSAAKYISEDPGGALWIGFGTGKTTGGKGLLRFENGRTRTYTTADGLPGDQVYQTSTDRNGVLWVGTGSGLAAMGHGVVTTYTKADGLPDDLVRAVRADRNGTIWAGTPQGLARFDGTRFTQITGLPGNDVESIYEDRDGVLWVTTDGGVARIVGGKIESADLDGVRDDRVHAVFEDRERNLWIGTHASGLQRLRAGKFVPWGPPEGLLGQSVHGILEDEGGRIWLGTAPGGVNVIDGQSVKTWSTHEGLPTKNPKAFYRDATGSTWIGTTDGLVQFENGLFTRFGTEDGLPHISVNVVREDRSGTLWAGTRGGLARRIGARFEPFPMPGTHIEEIRLLHEDVKGRMLVAGGDGAGYIVNGRFVPLLADVFGASNFTAVHEDRDGTLWLTTWGDGLYRVRNGRATHFTAADGLFDDTLWSIVDDGRGNFWMGSNRGIFSVARGQLDEFARRTISAVSSVVYGRGDGMRRRETNAGSPAAIRAHDGRLWFGTTAGAVVIDPAHMPMNRIAPNVVIDHLFVDEREVPLEAPLELRAGSRSLEINYAALSLSEPSRVPYRYRLEPFDDHWIDAGARRSAYYTNIDAGTYTFRVVAANEDGVWGAGCATLQFRLNRFFYETWWFYLAVLAAAVLLALLIRAARRHQLEIRHRVYHDGLTGLPNRMLLSERAEVALKQAERRGRSIAILFLDLDGFKGVNDRYGHAAGDELLKLVADRLRACIREVDTLARIGGDEFAALVADLEDESRAAEVAQRMIDAVSTGFSIQGSPITLGVSIGIAFHPYDGHDIRTILQSADRAMYRAKLNGGNQYQYNVSDRDEMVVI